MTRRDSARWVGREGWRWLFEPVSVSSLMEMGITKEKQVIYFTPISKEKKNVKKPKVPECSGNKTGNGCCMGILENSS